MIGKETFPFLNHFILKTESLPRHARDKHREGPRRKENCSRRTPEFRHAAKRLGVESSIWIGMSAESARALNEVACIAVCGGAAEASPLLASTTGTNQRIDGSALGENQKMYDFCIKGDGQEVSCLISRVLCSLFCRELGGPFNMNVLVAPGKTDAHHVRRL